MTASRTTDIESPYAWLRLGLSMLIATIGGVALLATKAGQLSADESMVTLEQLAPGPTPELGGALGRADDVGEEDGREDAVGDVGNGLLGNEARYFFGDLR